MLEDDLHLNMNPAALVLPQGHAQSTQASAQQ